MANPIKTTDIYQDTGELQKLIGELELVRKEYQALQKSIVSDAAKLEVSLKGVTGASADQREQIEKGSKSADEIAKRYKKFTESLDENAEKIAALKNAQTAMNQVNKLTAKLNAAQEGSYNKLSAQYSLLKLRLNQMSKAQREGTEEGRAAVKQSADLYAEMKRLQEETGKHVLNVGNYRDALAGLPGPLGGAVQGVKALGGQLKALLLNPIVAFITLIVGGLAALFNAFKQTETGAKFIGKAMAGISGAFRGVTKVLGDFAVAIFDAFSDPSTLLKKFGQFLKDQVINRFQAILEFGGAIGKLLRGEFTAAANQAAGALLKFSTGLNDVQIDGIKDSISDTADAFKALYDAELAVTRQNQALAKSIAKLTTEQAIANAIAGDATRSFKEREEAAGRARVALEKLSRAEIQVASNNLSIVNQKLKNATYEESKDLLNEQVSAIQALEGAERDYSLAVLQNERELAELKQDRLERDLDILIDGFDNQKTINERLIADESKTLSERAAIYSDTIDLAENSFKAQIDTIQQFTGVAVDANELLATSDAVTLNERIRSLGLSEIIEGRLLEVIRDRRTAVQDLSEVEADLVKARRAAAQSTGSIVTIESGANRVLERQLDLRDQLALSATKRNTVEVEDATPESIYDLLGFNLGSAEEQAITDATSFAIGQIQALAQAKTEAANQAVQASDREVQAAQANLQATLALAEQGYAANVSGAQAELALAEENQEKALDLQRKAAREQRTLETIQQASSLVTAAAKIFAEVPFPASLFAVGTMFGSFALAKVRASKLTREFGEGDYTVLSGPRHNGKGTGIPLGMAADGATEYAEGGESRAIFTRRAVSKYGNRIADVVKQFNALTFGEGTQKIGRLAMDSISVESGVNTGVMESYLQQISEGSKSKTYRDTKGRLVVQRGNNVTVYN
jgi:hypothetical protein